MPSPLVLHNGRFFREGAPGFADCLLVDQASGTITHVGSANDDPVRQARAAGAASQDLRGRIVLPGFIDGHMHLLQTGEALGRPDLAPCKNLAEIRDRIRRHAAEHPDLPRIVCRGWLQEATAASGQVRAADLDDLDPRPIFVHTEDLHSAWCNSAALAELGVQHMPDPPGGCIHRDDGGRPTGFLSESAALGIAWPFVSAASSVEERVRCIADAVDSYLAAGYTALVELAMDDLNWEALQLFRSRQPDGRFPVPLAMYWLVLPRASVDEELAQVRRAIQLRAELLAAGSQDCRVAGIKLLCDGVVDSCTAALREPYAHGVAGPDPIWPTDRLVTVMRFADDAGLQCAMHAIGDATIHQVIDALELIANPAARHRIEHLETCAPEDARRLGPLGIVASVQPVHSDPAIMGQWPRLLGPERCRHVFPYRALADAGAVMAIGTDSPTASLLPLCNLYTATTRRSAREPHRTDRTTPQFALSLAAAVAAATRGAAYSCFADTSIGSLEPGKAANLTVVDMTWDADKLLDARVAETWVAGRSVFRADQV
ncbi:hypothetical protein L249_4638 [Ophiocordyceps polyrhachis-furcata BCC 54312]|uniref:Amidohydrolase 3 domain-containing protein n=1 Tax=Ophiocordyceps polyrhachis-furcata BCC 54312 TaxID=1330021 RepID=A0A367L334_9HYPO|nr:hypothetical protein L249_4638 [Ophiocordyceps polyrhachis-furcata BCC 54312]